MTVADLLPDNELERLAAVQRYDILDTPADGTFDRIAALAAKLFDVPIAIVSVVDTDRIWFKAHHGLDATQIDREPGLCASAILSDGPWIVTDAAKDPRTLANPLVAGDFGLRFYAGAPLTTHDGYNLGTLCVIDREPREFTPEESDTLSDLAELVMDELELRRSARRAAESAQDRLAELEKLAGALQASLLPPSIPRIPFLDVSARYRPASKYEVGGDFYDVFPIDDLAWGFVIGDVMGKGPHAASRTSCARYSVRAAATYESRPSGVLQAVNHALLSEGEPGPDATFVTALFARARATADGAAVSFASAGHPLPILLRADGSAVTVGDPGTLLGALPALELIDGQVTLQRGDSLVLVTDGVHDSGQPPLQVEGLERLLGECHRLTASQIAARVYEEIDSAQRDDIAILVLSA